MSGVEMTDKDEIVEAWGEGFKDLAGFDIEGEDGAPDKPGRKHPRVHFFYDKIVVDLKQDVVLADGESTRALELQEPSTGDFRVMDGGRGSVSKMISFLCNIGNLTQKHADTIKGRDFVLLMQVINGFLSSAPETSGS